MTTQMNQHTRNRMWSADRRRGSIMLLVVGVLLLLMVLGTAYIQLVRQDRSAVGNVEQARRVSQVGQMCIDLTTAVMTLDSVYVPDNAGPQDISQHRYLTQTAESPRADRFDGEPYDYPGAKDRWLASTAPRSTAGAAGGYTREFNKSVTTEAVWPQISRISNEYIPLQYTENVDTQNRLDQQRDLAVADVQDFAGKTVAQIPRTGKADADADGDGFTDARWERAPLWQYKGRYYLAAYRIIDNSAMVNVNVASNLMAASGQYHADTHAPRWWFPSEINVGGVFRFYMSLAPSLPNSGSMPIDMITLNNYRYGGAAPGLPVPWEGSTNTRYLGWYDAASHYLGVLKKPYQSFGIENELELRFRNGLNNEYVTTELERAMPNMLRANSKTEMRYGLADIGDAFRSTAANPLQAPRSALAYFERNPRLAFTTVSGAAVYASPLYGESEEGAPLKKDVNKITLDQLKEAIESVYEMNTPAASMPGGLNSAEEFAEQFAACIKDYRDSDNILTKLGDSYGMEALPGLVEVYVQQDYQATNVRDAGGGVFSVTWQKEGDAGYAIEIRNPFGRDIDLENVYLVVNGSDFDQGELAQIAGVDKLGPGQSLVIWKQSSGPHGDFSDSFAGDVIEAKASAGWPAGDVEVKLEVRAESDSGADEGRVAYTGTVRVKGFRDSVNESGLSADPNNEHRYAQRNRQGNSRGINALIIEGDNYAGEDRDSEPSGDDSYDSAHHAIGQVEKPNGAADVVSDADRHQLVIADDQLNNGELRLIGELAHIAIVGPRDDEDYPQRWAKLRDPSRASSAMLDFGSRTGATGTGVPLVLDRDAPNSAPAYIREDAYAIPHAALLMDRLTTISPQFDDEDNDGDGRKDSPSSLTTDDGTTDPDELLIPGLININTATRDTLRMALPMPFASAADRDRIIDAIIKYRDEPASRPEYQSGKKYRLDAYNSTGDYKGHKGFTSIGELFLIPELRRALTDNQSGNTSKLGSTRIDFTEDMRFTDSDEEVGDDREEEMMIATWLSQVCTVRSDIYTAYILVRGFEDINYTRPVDEVRLIVIIDRSAMRTGADRVRVLGVYEY